MEQKKKIILFDGYCLLCSKSMKFILRRDNKNRFLFVPSQSKLGQEISGYFNLNGKVNESVILIDNGVIFENSTAVLKIIKKLGGLLPLFYILILLPEKLRDYFYSIISNNRYEWFGRKNQCSINFSVKDRVVFN